MIFIKKIETESDESVVYVLEDGAKVKKEYLATLTNFIDFEAGISKVQDDILVKDLLVRHIVEAFLKTVSLEDKRMVIDVVGLDMMIFVGMLNNEKGMYYNCVKKQ